MVRSLEALKKRAEKRGISLKEMMMKEKKQSTVVKPKEKTSKYDESEISVMRVPLSTPVTPSPHPPVSKAAKGVGSNVKNNNWYCVHCKNDNFAFRVECNRCCRPKSTKSTVSTPLYPSTIRAL